MKFIRLLALALPIAAFVPSHAASPEPVAAENGMVVTAHRLATRIGVDVLRKGGNAVDAAVAVGYALAVTYPAAGNLGGGGFMTLQLAGGRRTFIDFREKAPLAARADMFLDKSGKLIPGASTRGHLAVAVPGTVSGLEYAREKYGTMRRGDLVSPAIALAEEGFVLDQADAELFERGAGTLRADPASAKIFLDNGRALRAGSRLVQKDLARTLRDVARHGVSGFYGGRVAAALVASSRAGGGLITQADLDRYRAREFAPVECDYRGHHIVSAPPPSSGGAILCEMLNVLEGYPLREWGFGSARGVHVQIEAMRHAYVDRNSVMGDPAFVKNPVSRLIDKAYAAKIRAAIDPEKAGVSAQLAAGTPPHEGTNTTHYSIIDKDGNAASVTYTLNEMFGVGITAEGTGVLLNNEMDDFAAKPGMPNLFGLVQGEANAIAPGKRPLSSMTPTIVTRGGKPLLVLGTPGGSRIITTVLLAIVNMVDYGMDLQEAVDAPRFHQQWQPEETSLERFALSPDTRLILESMGHRFQVLPRPVNHVAAIGVGSPTLDGPPVANNRYYGANDSRGRSGLALGY